MTISDGAGHSTTTDSSGNYILGGLSASTYEITPSKSGYSFTPTRLSVMVPPNATSQDFNGVAEEIPPTKFLDLPFEYGGHPYSALFNWNEEGGRINSWFDHDLPTSPVTLGNSVLTPYTGLPIIKLKHIHNGVTCYGSDDDRVCYDDHNGYDFTGGAIEVKVAGDGVIEQAGCGSYGNQVIVDHGNHYYTLYGHLSSINLFTGTVSKGDVIGIAGGTGYFSDEGKSWCANKFGTHLHFGVYRDDGDGNWEGESIDKPVDPNGYFGAVDPWVTAGGPSSHWLWEFDRSAQTTGDSMGAFISDLAGDIEVSVPSAYFTEEVTLELLREPEIASPLESLRSAGYAFWLRLKELIGDTQLQQNPLLTSINETTIANPISITVTYTETATLHLDESEIALYRWDETLEVWKPMTSTVDIENNVISSQSLELGHFELQAPLLCSGDDFIHDDSFYGAMSLHTGGSTANRLFDVKGDEDWFSFEGDSGISYLIQTNNLASGVDTVIEIYDIDGVTLLASDNDPGDGFASKVFWQAPASGTYYLRVSQSSGSFYGCSASYDISVEGENLIYLPMTIR